MATVGSSVATAVKAVGVGDPSRISRGELWIGSRVLQAAGLQDDLSGHVALCRSMRMDWIFVPVKGADERPAEMDYRRFSPIEVTELGLVKGLSLGVILDGPIGRLAGKTGLWQVLAAWGSVGSRGALEEEAHGMIDTLSACMMVHPQAIIIADDIADPQSTFFNPAELRAWLFPHYRPLLEAIHEDGALALFHSDGNLEPVLDDLLACGFDGLAGCQHECMEGGLLAAREKHGPQFILMTGISADILESKAQDTSWCDEFAKSVRSPSGQGRFVLCSSSGIQSEAHLERLRILYDCIDK